ncbi:MAG: hypothetical protein Q9160_008287 [Pyrenula sp. 1 TL-2023]
MIPLSASMTQACQDLANNLPDRVFYPKDLKYKTETKQYWSKALRELKPACVILPTTAAEVSTIVKTLNNHPDVKFVVKSGGHSPNPGHASTDGGVLISLRGMASSPDSSNSRRDDLFSALHKFTAKGAQDPKAAIIFSNVLAVGNIQGFMLHFFYDGATPPATGLFADILKIPSLKDQAKTRTYSSLLRSAGKGTSSFTIPYVPSNPGMYDEISSKWSAITSPHLKPLRHASSLCTVTFQPFPSCIGKHSQAAGGNAMGLSSSDPDRIILEYSCKWPDKKYDHVLRGMAREMTAWLETKRPGWLAEAGVDGFMPYFMNDAAEDQRVMESFRNYEKLKGLQMEVDPEGLFRTRMGGFKY